MSDTSRPSDAELIALRQQMVVQRQRSERLQRALGIARVGLFTFNFNDLTVTFDEIGCFLHGFEEAQAGRALSFDTVCAHLASNVLHRALDEARTANLAPGAPFGSTYEVFWSDDSTHWVRCRGEYELDASGVPTALSGICMDADESFAYQHDLAVSENRLREAQAVGQTASWELLKSDPPRFVGSEQLAHIYGLSRKELTLEEFWAKVPKSDHHLIERARERAREPGVQVECTHRMHRADTGEIRWILQRGRAIRGDTGEVERYVGTCQDVTEQKRAQEATLESARTFRALTQTSPGLIFRAARNGMMTFCNEQRWSQFSGLPQGSWYGEGWLRAFHPADRDLARRAWFEAVAVRGTFQKEYRWRCGEGQIRWLLFHAIPVLQHGEVVGYVGTATDITALRISERERATLQLALAESQKLEAIGTLASGVAHDFNNMLAAVRGYLELVALQIEEPEDDEELIRDYLQRALVAVDQATDVTGGLLTFARGSGGQRKPVSLNLLIRENLSLLRQLVPASIEIHTELPTQDITVLGDATQLKQVLTNLVINSRDAMPDGGRVLVTLGYATDQLAVLVVQDSGEGMTPEHVDRAFEPFFSTKPHGEGSGLGLSVVHGIVHSHEGQIELRSTQRQGTEVEIRLPITHLVPQSTLLYHYPSASPGGRLLFVEDNPLVRESCALRLEASGFDVVSVEDGREAMVVVREADQPFEVAMLDVDLPGEDGVTVAEQLRQVRPGMPVVYVTGNAQNQALRRALADDPVLTKPINFNELFDTIQSLKTA